MGEAVKPEWTEPRYRDADGYEVSLETLCQRDPKWAANEIRETSKRLHQMGSALIRFADEINGEANQPSTQTEEP